MTRNSDENKKKVSEKTGHSLLLDGVAWFFFIMLLALPSLIFSDPNMQDPKIHRNKFTSRVWLEMIAIPLGGAIGIGRLIITGNKYFMILFPKKYSIPSQIFWYLKGIFAICTINILITIFVFK